MLDLSTAYEYIRMLCSPGSVTDTGVGNLKWIDSYNCEQLAESDTDKAEALQKKIFFSIYYRTWRPIWKTAQCYK